MPVDVISRILDQGISVLRRSSIETMRECGHKFMLQTLRKASGNIDVSALIGSVIHKASEDVEMCLESYDSPEYWLRLMDEVRDPRSTYGEWNGGVFVPLTRGRARKIAEALSSTPTDGTPSIGSIVHQMDAQINRRYRVLSRERTLDYNLHGLHFTGIEDLEVEDIRTGEIGIADCKTSGIASVYTEDGNPKTQSWDDDEITYHPQLRHYHWLRSMVDPGVKISFYLVVTPTNLFPLKKKSGDKVAGQQRGQLIHRGTARQDLIEDYGAQLKSYLRLMADRTYVKSMPQQFGHLQCPRCPVFKQCQGQPQSQLNEEILSSLGDPNAFGTVDIPGLE
jgi:hypothetical protein